MKEYYETAEPIESEDNEDEEIIEEQKTKKPCDPKLNFLISQLIVCCLALLAAFAIKFTGGNIYSAVRNKYNCLFNNSLSISEVMNAMSRKLDLSSSQVNSDPEVIQTGTVPLNESNNKSTLPESETQDSVNSSVSEENSVNASNSNSSESSDSELKTVNLSMSVEPQKTNINDMTVPVNGTVTSPFGYRKHPIYGSYLFHSGVDIGVDSGTDIKAALSGTVEEAEYSSSYGYYIIVSHTDSVKTVYAHCSKLLKSAGETIKQGDVIALSGSTGVSTGPHLHFEIRVGGICIDPLWILKL